MDKTIPLTLDIYQPVNPDNSFEIWRGDSVIFNFAFRQNGAELPLGDANKLRVFAKRVKSNQYVDKDAAPLFAGDFTGTLTRASFGSALTAGDAGNYLMTVMLMKDDTVITAQGVYFSLLENGYAGIYQPSEDFRDEVIDAKDQAQAAAKAAADSATAASGSQNAAASSASAASTSAGQAAADAERSETAAAGAAQSAQEAAASKAAAQAAQSAAEIAAGTAVNASDLAALCRRAENVGIFQFEEGYAEIPDSKGLGTPAEFSVCWTMATTDTQGNYGEGGLTYISNNHSFGSATSVGFAVHKTISANQARAIYRAEPSTASDVVTWNDSAYLDGKLHSYVFVGGNGRLAMYIDGLKVAEKTGANVKEIAATSNNFRFGGGLLLNTFISRVKMFGFDMSAEGAHYTTADYAAGMEEPPELLTDAILSFDDALSGPQILDNSSGAHNAIVYGGAYASKRKNPAYCSQTITWANTATLQNVCGDSAVPANSKVTAYAIASGAVTASFKAGGWDPETVTMSLGALTEIGSWISSGGGAFSVQPSAAYTGTIQVFLKIERL